jgi:hypothetical protein
MGDVLNLHYHQHEGEFAECTRTECVEARAGLPAFRADAPLDDLNDSLDAGEQAEELIRLIVAQGPWMGTDGTCAMCATPGEGGEYAVVDGLLHEKTCTWVRACEWVKGRGNDAEAEHGG